MHASANVFILLIQVYEWVMELIETRKAYMEEQGNPLGLLFVKSEKSKSQVLFLPHIYLLKE